MSWPTPKRFWQSATVRPDGTGFGVSLDAKPILTPAGVRLVVPTAALAAAIATEWDALATAILPDRLPLTRAANAAIDRVPPHRAAIVDAIAAYGASDLLCYRAAAPEALVALEAERWDPWLSWAARTLSAPLVAVTGVTPEPQPARSLAALRAAVDAHDAFALVALDELVALSGSLVLGLAVLMGALPATEAWDLSRVDETWQAAQWGLDSEAEAAAAARRADLLQARTLLDLLAPSASPPAC